MIEDKLDHDERVRLECLALGIQLALRPPFAAAIEGGDIAVAWAQRFESFVAGRQ